MGQDSGLIRIFAVRHGNTFTAENTPVWVGRGTDLELTNEGRRQAEQMGNFLKGEGISPMAVYSGELRRQYEAADIIASIAGGKRVISCAFDELEYGPWEGLTSNEIEQRWPEEFEKWNAEGIWPKEVFGGSPEVHIERLRSWIRLVQALYPSGATVVVVSSNGVLRFFQRFDLATWEELSRARKIMELKVKTGNYCELHIDPAQPEPTVESITRWDIKP